MEWSIVVASFGLVLFPVIAGHYLKTGIEKELFFNSIRAMAQLIFLAFVLEYLFKIEDPLLYIPIYLFMTLYAGFIGYRRLQFNYWRGVVVIGGVGALLLPVMVGLKIISLKPNQFLPILGMILGHSLNTYTQAVERIRREVEVGRELVESFIAVGAPLKEALEPLQKQAIKAALIPINNSLQTIGVISIPGITTGMLLAGASPFEAVSYQLAIVYMWVSINFLSAYGGTKMFQLEGAKRGLPVQFGKG
ncbi:MAG: ABC transporter permease [Campylobacterales bacterium]